MDLNKILEGVENKEELIKQIESEMGKEFVPRTEFNTKNTELKELQKQLGEVNTGLEGLTKEKATHEQTVAELNAKIAEYEMAAMRNRIALEVGVPYEMASRLFGDDEQGIRDDAAALVKLIGKQTPTPPLRSTEPDGDDSDAPYRALLRNMEGE